MARSERSGSFGGIDSPGQSGGSHKGVLVGWDKNGKAIRETSDLIEPDSTEKDAEVTWDRNFSTDDHGEE